MTVLDLVPARVLLRAGASALAMLLALAGRASASVIACGDTLAAGTWVLETDLVCDSASGSGVAITLSSGADLDLGGHSVGMTVGGSGTPILISGTGASLHDGSVTSGQVGIQVTGGGGHHLRNLTLANLLNIGIRLTGSNGNDLSSLQVSGMAVYGVALDHSDRNRLDRITITDTSGIGPAAGLLVFFSNGNLITHSQVLRSQCTGVFVSNSSRNTLCFNAVQDSFVSIGGPSADILVRDASTSNLVCGNQVSATRTPPVTSDGVNVGCKGGCHCGIGGPGISEPSTGATGNVVLGNQANGELRYGFAQSTGNPGNLYLLDQASGNGVANFSLDP